LVAGLRLVEHFIAAGLTPKTKEFVRMAKTNTTGTTSTTTTRAKKGGAKTTSTTKSSSKGTNTQATSQSMQSSQTMAPEERERMVQYAAYHIAEKDGFQSGREKDYWLQAEKQIDDLFSARRSSSMNKSQNTDERDSDIH
jgi:hypothetical protein